MAFRSKAEIGALLTLALCACAAAAEPLTFAVRHQHVRHDGAGTLTVTDNGIAYRETGKQAAAHSREWRFEDIEQLVLSRETLRVRTYEDPRWGIGHDREFTFAGLPKGTAARLYPLFSRRLDQRFVAALADDAVQPLWEAPVKLLCRDGSQGTLLVGADGVVYRTETAEQSRTWRIPDIEMVSTSGPFDLTVTSFERGSGYADRRDFHFTLKRPLAAGEYDALWRRVNRAKGLQILNSQGEQK